MKNLGCSKLDLRLVVYTSINTFLWGKIQSSNLVQMFNFQKDNGIFRGTRPGLPEDPITILLEP